MQKFNPRGGYGNKPRPYPSQDNRNRPPVGARPDVQLGAAIPVKNFRFLVKVLTEDTLSVLMDIPLQRIKELAEGINFTNESAHHIESMLGLKSGFLDQVNPTLTDEEIEELRTRRPYEDEFEEPTTPSVASDEYAQDEPMEEVPVRVVEHFAEEPTPTIAPATDSVGAPTARQEAGELQQQESVAAPPPDEATSEERVHSENAHSYSVGQTKVQVKRRVPKTEDSDEGKTSDVPPPAAREITVHQIQKSGATMENQESQALSQTAPAPATPVTEEMALREVRRTNLALITQMPGSKSQLGRLTGMSPANISHRLHGNKLFDDDTAKFFCEKLSLPEGWFNHPHTEDDIPDTVFSLLGNGDGRRTAPVGEGAPKTRKPRAPKQAIATSLGGASASDSTQDATAVAQPPAAVPASEPVEAPPAPAVQEVAPAAVEPVKAPVAQTPAPVAPAAPKPAAPVAAPVQKPAAPAPRPAPAPVAPAPVVTPQAAPAPAAAKPVVVSDDLLPIAEALVKTLALKARQGRLSEEQALKLLTDVVSM